MCTTFTVSNAVAAEQSACAWAVSEVPVPAGYEAKYTNVRGTDSKGNYSGDSPRQGQGRTTEPVIWTNGQPRVLKHPDPNVQLFNVIDENSSGTVLLLALVSGGGYATYLYTDAHGTSGTFTELHAPAGYRSYGPVALNERGDVLGGADRTADGALVGLLWPATGGAATVIERTWGIPDDLDDDGTVLLRDSSGNGGSLWRDGVVTPLASTGNTRFVSGIRGGKVIGYEVVGNPPSAQALLWDGSGAVTPIAGAAYVDGINAGGLVTGHVSTLWGKPGVWRNTTFEAELPLPSGHTDVASSNFVVGDDDELFATSNAGPLRWSCD
ncbi:hypothetical protein PV646_04500 [Streptomyces sp. ID05-26A]|nr:hypothetical protein [Streptomyces sp. ID05-26A]